MENFSIDEQKDIIDMYLNGESIDEIINKYNTLERYIRSILKDNNIDRKHNSFTDELYKRIIKLYIDGNNLREISETLFVSENCISNTLKKNNIKMRSTSECNMRYMRNKHYFDSIDTQNKAYILGLLFADGCNHISHNAITLALQDEDLIILEKIREEIQYEGKIRFIELQKKNINHHNQYVLCINDEYMSKTLNNKGMVNAKSLKLEFPNYIKMNMIRHFIRGYFDGDGCIYLNKKIRKTEVCITGTFKFVSKLSNIITSMNCNNSICHPKQSKNSNTYNLRICGYNSVSNFMEWIYDNADMYIERKYNKYLDVKNLFENNI